MHQTSSNSQANHANRQQAYCMASEYKILHEVSCPMCSKYQLTRLQLIENLFSHPWRYDIYMELYNRHAIIDT